MTGGEALIYARSRHRAIGGDFDRGRRQQRVLRLAARADERAVDHGQLRQPRAALSSSRSRPTSRRASCPSSSSLADSVDTKNIRSYVFSPPFYGSDTTLPVRGYIIEPNIARIRRAVKDAFSTPGVAARAARPARAPRRPRVWVLNGSGRTGLSTTTADRLAYDGLDASAPNQRVDTQPATTKIVVYNGAEAELPETIKYLENLFNVDGHDGDRPEGDRGHDRDAGRATRRTSRSTRSADAGRRPGPACAPRRTARRLVADGREPVAVLGQVAAHRSEVALADQPRDRADRARADRPVVDLDDGADLDAGAAQEHLVADVELGAVDRADLDGDPGVRRQLRRSPCA